MGSNQSSDKFHCNRYLDGQGPPSLTQQVNDAVKSSLSQSCQPEGQMTWVILHRDLPGFPKDNTLQINFTFPEGVQTDKHPHPGQLYAGQMLHAYLPDNREGRKVLKLLEKAFYQQLLFTIATSKSEDDVVTPAAIPLKTQPEGGTIVNGYPDIDYLKTVRKKLSDEGVK